MSRDTVEGMVSGLAGWSWCPVRIFLTTLHSISFAIRLPRPPSLMLPFLTCLAVSDLLDLLISLPLPHLCPQCPRCYGAVPSLWKNMEWWMGSTVSQGSLPTSRSSGESDSEGRALWPPGSEGRALWPGGQGARGVRGHGEKGT